MQATTPKLTGSGSLGSQGTQHMSELWDGFYLPDIQRTGSGIGFQTDFADFPKVLANVTGTVGPWNVFTGADANTFIMGGDVQGGTLQVNLPATDNADAYVKLGGNSYAIVWTPEDDTFPYTHHARVRFATRFLLTSVTDNTIAFFAGLGSVIPQTALLTANDSALIDGNFVGFKTLQADGDALLFTYQDAGQAEVNIALGAISANTWYRVGFDYNPAAKPAERLTIWLNDEKFSTFVTQTTINAVGFPSSTDSAYAGMSPTFGAKNGSAAANSAHFSHMRVCQEMLVAMGNEATG